MQCVTIVNDGKRQKIVNHTKTVKVFQIQAGERRKKHSFREAQQKHFFCVCQISA